MHTAPRLGLCVLLFGLLLALPARAAGAGTCGGPGRPWVSVTFGGARPGPSFEQTVIQDLRAGLAADRIAVCREADGPEHAALARVKISAVDGSSVGVSVDLSDAVTAKRVGRDLDLSSVPPDGRPFAVALAADELLRASWVEIALRPARRRAPAGRRAPAPPPEVSLAVDRSLSSRSDGGSRLGVRAAGERYAGGQTHLGADLFFRQRLWDRLRLELGTGLREGLSVNAANGRVRSSALGVRSSLSFAVIAQSSLELELVLGAYAAWLRFQGEARDGAEQAEFSGLSAYAIAGPAASLELWGPLSVGIGAGAGAPLRALEALDGSRVVTGVSGALIFGHAGLAVEF